MDHSEVFKYISSLFANRERIKDTDISEEWIQNAIYISLFHYIEY